MPRRGTEILPLTRPLPWWAVAVPAVAVAAGAAWPYLGVGGWLYIAPGRLGSLAHEAVYVTGTLAAVAAAWIAERFANHRSPTGMPSNWRAGWRQSLRVLAPVLGWWVAVQLAVSVACTILWTRQASVSTVVWADLVVAAAGLAFFTISGYLIGLVCARWFAPLLALGWVAVMDVALPLVISPMLPWAETNAEFYLYPAMMQQDHRSLNPSVMVTIAVWWLAVLALLVTCVGLWRAAARPAQLLRFVTAVVACAVLTAGVIYIPYLVETPFTGGAAPPLVCTSADSPPRICVTQEQASALTPFVQAVTPVIERVGDTWPDDVTTVASWEASAALEAQGTSPQSVAVSEISSYGLDWAPSSLATSLADGGRCRDTGGSPLWAFAFSSWLAPGPSALSPEDPVMAPFVGKPDRVVLDWFAQNVDALRACTYDGPGPA